MKRRWSSMDNLMHRAVNRMRFAPQIEAAAVCQTADRLAAGRYRAVSYREDTLKVAVPDYDAAASLRPQIEHLIGEINREVGADAVRRLQIEVRPNLDKTASFS